MTMRMAKSPAKCKMQTVEEQEENYVEHKTQ